MDPFILLRLPLYTIRWWVQRWGWKSLIACWILSIIGILIYEARGGW